MMSAFVKAKMLESKTRFIQQIWMGAGVIALVDMPLAIWRASEVGWHPQLIMHFCLFVITGLVALFRQSIDHRILGAGAVFFSSLLGLAGVFTLGMSGAGFFWIAFSTFLVTMLYDHVASLWSAALTTIVMIVAAMCFVNGIVRPPFDLAAHSSNLSAWVNFLVIIITVPYVTLFAMKEFSSTTAGLLEEIERQRDKIAADASTDDLTGLPTMKMANDRLKMAMAHASRTGEKVAVLFIDLDGFKAVNDTYTHAIGNEVLKLVSKRMTESIRSSDTVARVGGDEFVAILIDAHDLTAVKSIAAEIIERISLPIPGLTVGVGASIGISIYPDHGSDLETLKDTADKAMYCAKRGGKNRFNFYEGFTCE